MRARGRPRFFLLVLGRRPSPPARASSPAVRVRTPRGAAAACVHAPRVSLAGEHTHTLSRSLARFWGIGEGASTTLLGLLDGSLVRCARAGHGIDIWFVVLFCDRLSFDVTWNGFHVLKVPPLVLC